MKRTRSTEIFHATKGSRSLGQSKKCAGVTFVETIVALSLFAVFTTGACKLLLSHRKVSDMAREHYTAINIAKNRMELVRTFDFGQVDDFTEDNVMVDSSGTPDTEGYFRRTTEVSNVSSNLVEITITVDIRNRKTLVFNPANEVLSTYFAEYLASGGGTSPATP